MNLRAALRNAGIRYTTKPSDSNEVLLNCPFCVSRGESPDTRFRCAINVAKNAGNCKNCDWSAGAGAIEEVARQLKLDAARDLWSFADARPEQECPEDQAPPEYGPPEGYTALAGYSATLEAEIDPVMQAIAYVKKRRITWEQVEKYAIGVCLRGRYAYRVIFPVFRLLDKPVLHEVWSGFIARDFTDNLPKKVLNASCPMPLYNYQGKSCAILGHSITDEQFSQVKTGMVISEGIIKALAIERAMKLLSPSEWQAGGVLLFPDPDPQGLRGFLKVAWALSQKHRVFFPREFPRKQADEMLADDLRVALSNTVEFSPMLELDIRAAIQQRLEQRMTY